MQAINLIKTAQEAGYSPSTVSMILNGRGQHYRTSTRQAVRDAAKRLGYRPNGMARAVRTGRFGCVALLQSTQAHQSYLPWHLFSGLCDALAEKHMHLAVGKLSDSDRADVDDVPKYLREHLVDGLLVNYNFHVPKYLVELIEQYPRPTVWMHHRADRAAVYFDVRTTVESAVKRMIELGHRRIGFVDLSSAWSGHGVEPHHTYRDYLAGYQAAMASANLEPILMVSDHKIPRCNRIAKMRRIFSQPDRPTAVLCGSDSQAYPAIVAATELGLRVPRDISLVTMMRDDSDDTMGLRLTCVTLPTYEMGRKAVQLLMQMLAREQHDLPSIVIPCGFDLGQTLAPPAS